MVELPYRSIPDPPEEVTATSVLARLVDGLGFRYRWATEGLRGEDYEYRPSPDSMSVRELLKHIHGLVSWTLQGLCGEAQPAPESPSLQEIRGLTLEKIERMSKLLAGMSPERLSSCRIRTRGGEYPFWNMVNGPLSDALTHVGQINSWRRLNGNPVPGHNVFLGEPRG
jgi:hypothetical protein